MQSHFFFFLFIRLLEITHFQQHVFPYTKGALKI